MQHPDLADLRTTLRQAGTPTESIAAIGEGRTAWTYVVDHDWIVQIPRYPEVDEAARRQAALMPVVREHVPFAVPVPELIAHHGKHPVLRHRMVPGRALHPDDHWQDLAAILRALHRIPLDRIAPALGLDPTAPTWHGRYAHFRDQLDSTPHLPEDLRSSLTTEFDHYLAAATEITPAFVHADLATEHVLVDPHTRRPTGLIDFDWATIGDPALDFVGALSTLGPTATRELIRDSGEPVCWHRLLFHWCLNPCYALIHAGHHLDPGTRAEHISTVRTRLNELQN